MAVLLREALGESLRRVRTEQGRTLRDVSTDARVSLGYLSEVERGQKEASSELLAAICDALEIELADILLDVGHALSASVGATGEHLESSISDTTISATKVVIPAPGRSSGALAAA